MWDRRIMCSTKYLFDIHFLLPCRFSATPRSLTRYPRGVQRLAVWPRHLDPHIAQVRGNEAAEESDVGHPVVDGSKISQRVVHDLGVLVQCCRDRIHPLE